MHEHTKYQGVKETERNVDNFPVIMAYIENKTITEQEWHTMYCKIIYYWEIVEEEELAKTVHTDLPGSWRSMRVTFPLCFGSSIDH